MARMLMVESSVKIQPSASQEEVFTECASQRCIPVNSYAAIENTIISIAANITSTSWMGLMHVAVGCCKLTESATTPAIGASCEQKIKSFTDAIAGFGFFGRFVNICSRAGLLSLSKTAAFSLSVFSAFAVIPFALQNVWSACKKINQLVCNTENKSSFQCATFFAHVFSCLSSISLVAYGSFELVGLFSEAIVVPIVLKGILMISIIAALASIVFQFLQCCVKTSSTT